MTIKNYEQVLDKNEVYIYVPSEYILDEKVFDLTNHLENMYGFKVSIIPGNDGEVFTVINQSTVMRCELVGALAYYRLEGLNYVLCIEQWDNSLWVNNKLF